jgi:hypothetical protein
MSTALEALTVAAEQQWLASWTAGPTEGEGASLPSGTEAPDLALLDHLGLAADIDNPALEALLGAAP